MPISQKIKDLIFNAWTDGSPCLLATPSPEIAARLAKASSIGIFRLTRSAPMWRRKSRAGKR
jgi:hypothetical protein